MIVIWSPEAEKDRLDIWEFLYDENPRAAIRIDTLFDKSAELLANHPKAGVIGSVWGTKELFPHESYRMIYEIKNNQVWILALVHTSRMWPL